MKKNIIYLLACLLIYNILACLTACDNYTINISAVGRQPSNEFVWTSGEDIMIAVNFTCNYGLNNTSYYVFSWKRRDESNSGYGNYIMYTQYSGLKTTDHRKYHSYVSYTFQSFSYGFNVNFTISTSLTTNGSRLVVFDVNRGGIILSVQEVIVKSKYDMMN